MLMQRLLYAMLLLAPLSLSAEVLELRYQDFTIWLNTDKRSAINFHYHLDRDVGNVKRDSRFYLDPELDRSYQQTEIASGGHSEFGRPLTITYNKNSNLDHFDRGHLVPFNHMDHSLISSHQTNYMTNVLPQAANMNQGAWRRTEEITECYRDYSSLDVIGGAIWGKQSEYLEIHSIYTPIAFWKVIIRQDDAIAWIIPNKNEAVGVSDLDKYLISIDTLEKRAGVVVPVDPKWKRDIADASSWDTTHCDKHSPKDWRS